MKKEYYDKKISNSPSLPDIFKELEDIKNGKIKVNVVDIPESKEKIHFSRINIVNHKSNMAGLMIGVLFIVLFFSSIHSNYIFATTEEEKVAIGTFEKNNNALDMINIVSQNVSELTQKEIITEEIITSFETIYVENTQLPKDEQIYMREGKNGSNKVTKIRTYENEELVDENIISTTIVEFPVDAVIEIGTSEFLRDVVAHIGDVLYTKEQINLYSEPLDQEDKVICFIYPYIDVNLKSVDNEWAYIIVDGIEGYVKSEFLTTEYVTFGIAEKNRLQRICLSLKEDMPLNTPSGLTKEDFIKILSNNPNDENKIFENNAELFYEIERKYNVNGVFIAAMGIHESNWGRSTIANNKKNLFGYGAYDSDAYGSAYTFESYEYGIELVTKVLVKYYLNYQGTPIYNGEIAIGTYYNGPTLSGVNTRYASDQEWHTKVFNTMKSLYQKLY